VGGREGARHSMEQGHHRAEGEPRIGVAVQEDYGFPCWVALFGIVEPRPVASCVVANCASFGWCTDRLLPSSPRRIDPNAPA
jgi:hypothetical protein